MILLLFGWEVKYHLKKSVQTPGFQGVDCGGLFFFFFWMYFNLVHLELHCPEFSMQFQLTDWLYPYAVWKGGGRSLSSYTLQAVVAQVLFQLSTL